MQRHREFQRVQVVLPRLFSWRSASKDTNDSSTSNPRYRLPQGRGVPSAVDDDLDPFDLCYLRVGGPKRGGLVGTHNDTSGELACQKSATMENLQRIRTRLLPHLALWR